VSSVRVVRLYTGFQFFFSMLLWVPFFYEYQKTSGLSDMEIFGIQSIYYLAFCLLEFPTGFLADAWGYRACLRLGAGVLIGSNLLPVFLPTYLGFLAHFLTIALARSLISGASSAYLYEYLSQHGAGASFKEAEGRARAWGLFGKVILWAAMGWVMRWGASLPYTLTAACALVSLGFAVALPPVNGGVRHSVTGVADLVRAMGPVLRIVQESRSLAYLMLLGVGTFVLVRIGQINLFQPVLKSWSVPSEFHGLIMSGMTLFEAFGSAYPGAFRRWFSDLSAVLACNILMAISLSFMAEGGNYGTVVAFCLLSWAAGVSFPLQRQLLNDAIPTSRYRASLLSLESLVDRSVCAAVAPTLGWVLAGGQLRLFLHGVAGLTLVGTWGLVWSFTRRRRVASA